MVFSTLPNPRDIDLPDEEKKKPATPPPKWRDYLMAWPEGETRFRTEMKGPRRPPGRRFWQPPKSVMDGGYLTHTDRVVPRSANQQYSQREDGWKRTDKVVKAHQPRGPKPNYVGDYPWSVDDHWQRMAGSPLRVAISVRQKLNGVEDPDIQYKGSPEEQLAFPTFITTPSELVSVRRQLAQLMRGGLPKKNRYGKERYTSLANGVRPLLLTGVGVRLLCIDMLVEPVFDAEGNFERFVALDPEQIVTTLERTGGSGTTLAEKYKSYMEAHGNGQSNT